MDSIMLVVLIICNYESKNMKRVKMVRFFLKHTDLLSVSILKSLALANKHLLAKSNSRDGLVRRRKL